MNHHFIHSLKLTLVSLHFSDDNQFAFTPPDLLPRCLSMFHVDDLRARQAFCPRCSFIGLLALSNFFPHQLSGNPRAPRKCRNLFNRSQDLGFPQAHHSQRPSSPALMMPGRTSHRPVRLNSSNAFPVPNPIAGADFGHTSWLGDLRLINMSGAHFLVL